MGYTKYEGGTFVSKGSFKKLGSIIEYIHENIDLALYNIRIVTDPHRCHTRIEVWTMAPSVVPAKVWDLFPDQSQQIVIPTWMLKPPDVVNKIPYYHY